MYTIDPSIVEALKIFLHFFLAALAVVILRRFRINPLIAMVLGFMLIMCKEFMDMGNGFVEFDDMVLNLAGAIFGSFA